MHIGNLLSSELKKKRITVADVAKAVNKSDTGVRKDLEKDSLHQSVIEAYSKVLGLNLYRILAEEYDEKFYPEQDQKEHSKVSDDKEVIYTPTQPQKNMEVLSVNIAVPADKQEALLKLLMS